MNKTLARIRLDNLDVSDPELAHIEAEKILLTQVPPSVAAAYRRVVKRARWWATS